MTSRNHPRQVRRRGGPNDAVDDRATPVELFQPLHDRFAFTVDAAAAPHNARLPRFWTIDDDGLAQDWTDERVWCNPPFSSIEPWVEKAWASRAALVVMLVPANRTEQGWWQRLVEPYRDRAASRLHVEFLSGRPRFVPPAAKHDRPIFGCVLLIWTGE